MPPSHRRSLLHGVGAVDLLTLWTLACLAATTWLLLRAGREWDTEQT